ncbi:MOSC domain-containing protein [Sporichthya sp.]|uniref:MOSC domain-containing protein n=1 Tax=Sporichthya sp. TaxID=65475 RepID=UPI0017D279D0|nr:MOSC domain-containing protein [Sporichthya sp.]MBA3744157.1 MOSC domain-containing protein [Sporichthya sp.]
MPPAHPAHVLAVSLDAKHRFSKQVVSEIQLRADWGVEGDAHAGTTVQHRSRKRWRPTLPNLRQVHLLHAELHDEFAAAGYSVAPGQLGENITTRGLDLLALPTGTVLRLGAATIEVTGLRNPCVQIDRFEPGLLAQTLGEAPDGSVIRKTGVMGVVLTDGRVRAGDEIVVELPAGERRPLAPV